MKVRWYPISAMVLVMAFTLITPLAQAVPPTPEVMAKIKADGRLQDYIALDKSARRRGLNKPDEYRLTAGEQAAVVGNLKALVILVDFSDNPATGGGSYSDSTHFNQILFSVNNPGVSLNDLYQEMSYGKVTVTGECVGYLRMPQTYAYYVDGQRGFGSYPHNAQKLAEDAIDAAEAAGVDFSQYDVDGNGRLDGVFIVHAGPGYETTGNLNYIHSHAWSMTTTKVYDGISIRSYTMEPEESGDGSPIKQGVFSHEYGHFIGLPDLYDTDYTSEGLGRWELMAGGSYNGNSASPAHMGVWCKMKLGWINPIQLTTNVVGAQLPQTETDSIAYRIWTNGAGGSEYFLVENRQRVGFDKYLPGSGLLIFHIDDGKSGNTQEWYPGHTSSGHYLVALEQADGRFDLDRNSSSGDASDPWPGTYNKREFGDGTTPDSKAYNGTQSKVGVWNISDSDSLMTANLDVDFSRPRFMFVGQEFTDDGNADGVPDPGEQVDMLIREFNAGLDISDVYFSVSTEDTTLVFSDSTAFVGTILTNDSAINYSDPITFSIPANHAPMATWFYITVTGNSGAYVKTDTVRINIGADQILVVDDDAGSEQAQNYDSLYYLPLLDELGIPYSTWDVAAQGTPSTLNDYPMVVWWTGDKRSDPISGPDPLLSASERAALSSYLDQGGHLFLTGQQIALMLNTVDPGFLNNYLKAQYAGPSYDLFVNGEDGDVVGDGTRYVLAGAGGAANQNGKDLLIPIDGAVPVFREDYTPANVNGIRYEGTYKLLFLGWGLEGIGDDVTGYNSQPKDTLMMRAINWLLYDAVFTGVSLSPLVTNPGQDPNHLLDTAITLHWNFSSPVSAPQDSVEIQVGSDIDWTAAEYWTYGPVASGDTSVHYAGTPVVVGNTYYWRIRVFSDGVWSSWRFSSFHMDTRPAPPQPNSPIGDQIATQNGPILRTNNANDPEGDFCTYDFEVYQDSALTTLLASTTGVTQGSPFTTWTVDVILPENQRAWWRTRANDGYLTSDWSVARSFYVDGINEPPTAPALLSPEDSTSFFGTDLIVAWNTATDPDLVEDLHYRVRVDTNPDFSTATVYDSIPDVSLSVPGALEMSKAYYWDVTTVDKGGLEAASATWHLQTLMPGDANFDGMITSADVIFVVNYVFKGGPAPDPVRVADADASCTVTSADIIALVNFVFRSGQPPQPGCDPVAVAAPHVPDSQADGSITKTLSKKTK